MRQQHGEEAHAGAGIDDQVTGLHKVADDVANLGLVDAVPLGLTAELESDRSSADLDVDVVQHASLLRIVILSIVVDHIGPSKWTIAVDVHAALILLVPSVSFSALYDPRRRQKRAAPGRMAGCRPRARSFWPAIASACCRRRPCARRSAPCAHQAAASSAPPWRR